MSYSRWIGSYWYTFWCVQPSGKEETRDNALFEICTVAQFTSKELRDNIDECINKIKDIEVNVNQNELDELKVYMEEFLKDVDKEYPKIKR